MISEFEQGAKRRARILERLNELVAETDAEKARTEAGALLLEYLELIGARDLVAAYKAITSKHYA